MSWCNNSSTGNVSQTKTVNRIKGLVSDRNGPLTNGKIVAKDKMARAAPIAIAQS
jgi:hypothetical protein